MINCNICYYRKICTLFKTRQDVQGDIKVQILGCNFYRQDMQTQMLSVRSYDLDYSARSDKIKAAQPQKSKALPVSVSMTKGTGMHFSVDDKDIS